MTKKHISRKRIDLVAEIIGERIYKERYRQGLTQEQLADEIGIARVTLTNVENGRSTTTIKNLIRIGRALGIRNIGDFLKGF